jgi:hypothetical protein
LVSTRPLSASGIFGAVVEDEVQIDRADRKWKANFGRGVSSQNMASLGVRSTEVLKLVDVSNN